MTAVDFSRAASSSAPPSSLCSPPNSASTLSQPMNALQSATTPALLVQWGRGGSRPGGRGASVAVTCRSESRIKRGVARVAPPKAVRRRGLGAPHYLAPPIPASKIQGADLVFRSFSADSRATDLPSGGLRLLPRAPTIGAQYGLVLYQTTHRPFARRPSQKPLDFLSHSGRFCARSLDQFFGPFLAVAHTLSRPPGPLRLGTDSLEHDSIGAVF